jgi:hypothetical protein
MALRLFFLMSLCGCLICLSMPACASPAPVTYVDGTTYSISKVTDKCNGLGMAGMSITFDYVYRGTDYSQTLSWTTVQGIQAGRTWVYDVNNPKQKLISLVEIGDTSTGNWTLTAVKNVTLKEVDIDGFPGKTVFDTTFNHQKGTPGSGQGKTAKLVSLLPKGATVSFTYQDLVQLQNSTGPVGDLYRCLDIKFAGTKAVPSLVFQADTAAGCPTASPVPVLPSLVLISSGLSFLWGVKKRAARISRKV